MAKDLKQLWYMFQPMLFALIGFSLKFASYSVSLLITSVMVIFINSIARFTAGFLTMRFMIEQNPSSSYLVAGKWCAKASIQASLSTLALDAVTDSGLATSNPQTKYYANVILVTYLIAVLISAPLGAIWVALMGEKMLTSDEEVLREKKKKMALYNDDLKKSRDVKRRL
jgi:NhaP-type Na+/H+ or K+/H+ antiporter